MMVEVDATQDPAAVEDAPATAADETPIVTSESASAQESPVEAPEDEIATLESSAPQRKASDWSHLRGFQTVEEPAHELASRPEYAEELAKELHARAVRFAQSVDESIVLSSDGLIRWLGDPVARAVSGEALLKPHSVLLADEALGAEERTKVETRVSLWLTAHIRKVLGPLLALSEGVDVPEAGRGLSEKIAEALGVLERERVRAEVKALDQTARASLRKQGVRFGSLYIYVPALLKPGARSLCTLLWTLRRGAETGADRLLAFASAGRTSFANEGLLSPDAYRVAGFRLCGERVVRVDIIERLSDLIRAAIPDHMRFGSRPASEAYGFVVAPQMTSLTGCSGEAFASILRSLGFEPTTVSKSAFEAAHRKAPTEPLKPATAAAEAQVEVPVETQAPAVEAASEDAEADTTPVQEEAAPIHLEASPETEIASESVAAISEPESEAMAAPVVSGEADAGAPLDLASEPPAPGDAEAPSAQAVAESDAAPAEDVSADAPAPSEEMIEIWRPAPRRPRVSQRPNGAVREPRAHHGRPRDSKRHGPPPEAAQAAEAAAAGPVEAAPAPMEAPAREKPERREEGPRRFDPKGKGEGRPREDRRPGKDFGPRREPRPVQVDPDSPFAKLAALKPLLERRDKRT